MVFQFDDLKKKTILLFISAPLVGAGIGFAFMFFAIKNQPTLGETPWRTYLNIGASDESLLQKAIRTRVGIYALPKEEVIYFMASTDSDGELLTSDQRYEVSGIAPATKIWSITLYDKDFFLSNNALNRYHFNATSLNVEQGKPFSFVVSSTPEVGNWLPAPQKGNFALCYRFYLPPASAFPINESSLPKIKKL